MASEEQNKPPEQGSSTVVTATPAGNSVAQAVFAAYGNSEWAASLHAYYSGAVAASPHLWPGQHMMSPYGTPIPFSHMYPPGAYYTHPSMGVSMAYASGEGEARQIEGKSNKSNGNSGNSTRVTPEKQGSSGSGNNGSRSGDSGSEESSETRDDDAEQKDSSATKKRKYGNSFMEGESSQAILQYNSTNSDSPYNVRSGRSASKLPVSAPGRTAIAGPTPNLNIGMDIWNTSHTSALSMNSRPNDLTVSEHPMDERELKKERRKQSNRESARRSRLRKQQECDELARRVAELGSENSTLLEELNQLKKDCQDIETENSKLLDEMIQLHGPGVISEMGLTADSLNKAGNHENKDQANNANSNKINGNFISGNGDTESTR